MLLMILFGVLLLATVLIAFIWGGGEERWIATIALIVALLSPLTQISAFGTPEKGLLALDLMLLLLIGQVALTSDKYWPLAATAFHFNTLIVHLMQVLYPQTIPEVYADAAAFWAYPVQLSIILGVLVEKRLGHRAPPFAGSYSA